MGHSSFLDVRNEGDGEGVREGDVPIVAETDNDGEMEEVGETEVDEVVDVSTVAQSGP